MFRPSYHPRLELIVGPMFSGKSAELVRRARLAEIAHQRVQVFRPLTDTRTPEQAVFSRNGTQVAARTVVGVRELIQSLADDVEVVGFDEAQFFEADLADAVQYLLVHGKRIIVAALDLDFASRPFGAIPSLLALADTVDKLTAVCQRCHSLFATRTQRLVDGAPATVDSPVVLVDDAPTEQAHVAYEARCIDCYQPPTSGPWFQPSYWEVTGT
ncbi:MAG: thymidine kinase [Chloroflexi bacterium]|nr:thymidine kinase [Chloroflexota bacterium]